MKHYLCGYIPLIDSFLFTTIKGVSLGMKPLSSQRDQKVDRQREAPIIFCDAVPEASYNATQRIVDLSLATTLPQSTRLNNTVRPLVIVADLKIPLEAAKHLRDMLDKILLHATAKSSAH